MSENAKITPDHLRRCALVHVRQSTAAQVEHKRESTERQYKLVDHVVDLGWKRGDVNVVDQDLGISGAGVADRSGVASMTAQMELGQIGIVLGQGHHVRSGVTCAPRSPRRWHRQQGGPRRQLRRGLPVGFVWGDDEGEVHFHPDEATKTIRTVFDRFAEMGSVHQVWLPFRSQELLIARLTAVQSTVTVATDKDKNHE